MTRRTREGALEDPDQALTVQAALEGYTIEGARAAGLGEVCGSLEAGKRADLAILSANPLEVDPGDLLRIRVLETWIMGRRIAHGGATAA